MSKPIMLLAAEQDEKLVCKMYLDGKSIDKIAKTFGTSIHPIKRILKKYNIVVRKPYEQSYCRKYEFKFDFFKEVNQLSSYWAGFIAADGNLDGNLVQLNLNARDYGHLELLAYDLGLDKKPCLYSSKDNRRECYLSFSSKEIVDGLIKNFLVTGLKSCRLELPPLDDENLRHYIRGYFDGDGCLKIEDTSSGIVLRIEILGTEEFLLQIKTVLVNKLSVSDTEIRQAAGIKSLQWGGKQISSILNWLYKEPSYRYLSRKLLKSKLDKLCITQG